MTHFAEIDIDGNVKRVIVAEQEIIDSGIFGNPENWIKTSYNTINGIHKTGGTPLRKNYAGIGYKYDKNLDAFIPPKRFDSWILDTEKCVYVPPVEMPKDDSKVYSWNEIKHEWDEYQK